MAQSVGAAGAGNILSALYEVDFEDTIPLLVGEEGKLAKFLGTLPKGPKLIARYADWGYSEVTSPIDTVTEVVATGSLVFPVANIDQWKPYNLVLLPSGETCLIDSVDRSLSQFTVFSRVRGSNAAVEVADNAEIIRMGTAMPDGSSVSEARMQVDVTARNYVQTFYENVDFDLVTTAINENGGFNGGDFEARKRTEALLKFLQDQDTAHLWGEGSEDDGSRSMTGVGNLIASTETATIAALTELALDQHLETKGFLYGAEHKIAITSNTVIGGMNRYAKGRMQTQVGGKRYGYDMRFYDGPGATLEVMPHHLMSVSANLRKIMLILDKRQLKCRVLRNQKLYTDIDAGTRLAKMDMWLTMRTMTAGHPRHHSRINGITSFT